MSNECGFMSLSDLELVLLRCLDSDSQYADPNLMISDHVLITRSGTGYALLVGLVDSYALGLRPIPVLYGESLLAHIYESLVWDTTLGSLFMRDRTRKFSL